jgi:hypothetical protein
MRLRVLSPALTLTLATALALARGAQDEPGEPRAPAPVATQGADDFGRATSAVSLAELREHPSLWLGRRVSFVLQVQRTEESWNPCLSRFGPGQWLSVRGWADEEFVWDEHVYADPATRIFVRRGSHAAELVLRTPAYSRVAVTGRVREVFLDEPWIEIEALEPLVEEVGEGTILHVGRALELLASGQFELALSQLERAKAAPLPAHARAEIERLSGVCEQAREETEELRRALH